MSRPLITLMLTLALGAPVAADQPRQRIQQDDLIGLLVGSVLVGVVVSQLAKGDDDKGHEAPPPAAPAPRPPVIVAIPGHCVTYDDDLDGRYALTQRCLYDAGIEPADIPTACRMADRYDPYPAIRYDLRCLEYHGWQLR